MRVSDAGRHEIKNWEGLRLAPYLCPAGKWTVGFGKQLYPQDKIAGLFYDPNKKEWTGKIDIHTAEELLTAEIRKAEGVVLEYVTAPLKQAQFDALVSFVFNVGRQAFARSTLLKRLNAGDFTKAAAEFSRWCRDGSGTVIQGLKNRREHERRLFTQT